MFTDYTPMTDDEVAFTHQVLRDMKALDADFRAGSRYDIGLPVPEAELQDYEEKCGIALPVDYRSFLLRVGPGAGPGYGVEPRNAEEDLEMCDFGQPFPHTEKGYSITGSDFNLPGIIQLGYYVGDSYMVLVVRGSARGTVWEAEAQDEYSLYKPTGKTFGQWYAGWLHFLNDVAAPKLRTDAIVEKVTPGMRRADLIALCSPAGGVWRESRLGEDGYTLEFGNLLTWFRMREVVAGQTSENDEVASVFRYGIYYPMIP